MGVLGKAITLVASISVLDQTITNGLSLGTLTAPTLPKFLSDTPLSDGYPWGKDTVKNADPYHSPPDTGKTRKYDFTIKRATLAPDGFERDMIVINGQYPGPTIEGMPDSVVVSLSRMFADRRAAHWGDMIQVTVHNQIEDPAEGTSIHWHGFLQHNNSWMDGTPGFTQCPLAPGKSLTYTFKAELFGTSWYHTHYSAQYADGGFGPVVIYGPWDKQYDIDIGPITLNDFYHVDWYAMVKNVSAPRPNQPQPNPTSDSNLINGKMRYDCSLAPQGAKCSNNAGLAEFRFQSGKTHRLRLINTGADASQQFSIDGHRMTVIANDFVAVEPYNTTVVTIGVGQRTDVVVQGIGDPSSSYWMRSNITCASSVRPNAVAVIYYENADTKKLPTTQPWMYQNVGCVNDPLSQTVPEFAMAPSRPDRTMELDVTVGQNASGVWLWYMNGSPFRTDYSDPVLHLARGGNTTYSYSPQWNVYNSGRNSSYRFILNNRTPRAHPMHLHDNMYILDVGVGAWDGKTIVNPSNPQRRDTQMVPANGYMVIQADADNPGAWAFHCHILWHSSTGFGIDILEQPDQIAILNIPEANYQLCRDWNAFVGTGQEVQIDSGA